MTATPDAAPETPKKGSKLPLLIGLVLAIAGGGGGFFAVSAGLLPFAKAETAKTEDAAKYEDGELDSLPQFVALDPMVISLPPGARRAHLRFADLADLEAPTALMRLRAQMLRRVQIVAGEGKVKDLLIMEFVLS